MATTPELKLQEMLTDFGVAMLVTRTDGGELRGRPMAIAEVETDGTVWFFTDRHSAKVHEFGDDAHVCVAMQTASKFLSLSGTGSVVEDRARAARLWKVGFQVWFQGGMDDPNLALLRVVPGTGEYWDNSGTSGTKYLIEAGKALLVGTRPQLEDDPKIHAKVKL